MQACLFPWEWDTPVGWEAGSTALGQSLHWCPTFMQMSHHFYCLKCERVECAESPQTWQDEKQALCVWKDPEELCAGWLVRSNTLSNMLRTRSSASELDGTVLAASGLLMHATVLMAVISPSTTSSVLGTVLAVNTWKVWDLTVLGILQHWLSLVVQTTALVWLLYSPPLCTDFYPSQLMGWINLMYLDPFQPFCMYNNCIITWILNKTTQTKLYVNMQNTQIAIWDLYM